MINRRNFLKNTSLIAAGGLLAGKVNMADAAITDVSEVKASKVFGLQLYSLGREFPGENAAQGLRRLAQMGYSTLELASYNVEGKTYGMEMKEFGKIAQDAGLKIVSSHVGAPVREFAGENLDKAKEFWKKACDDHASIGVKYLIQPGQPATRSVEEVKLVGEAFNEAGKIAKAVGMTYGYHNHSGEFMRVVPGGTEAIAGRGGGFGRQPEGAIIIQDGLIEATDPSLVIFELDVYWTVMGQSDPVAYMRKYADRIRVLHIKDIAILGESGMMNFQKIFEVAYENRISDFIVELENYTGGQFNGVKGCADYLLKAPFVKYS